MVAIGKETRLLTARRLLHKINLLCSCGAGIAAIAGPVSAAVRQLVDGDNGGIFWLNAEGQPAGFFHETHRVDLKDLFITRFDEMFVGPGQENMLTMTETVGPRVGRALARPDAARQCLPISLQATRP